MRKTPEQLYSEREKRINDAIQLREPDRVPVVPLLAFFCCHYAGIMPQEAFEDAAKATKAWEKTIKDLEPDATYSVNFSISAPHSTLEELDFKAIKWPGHGVSPHHSFQFVEGEYMLADEYEAFLSNTGDYLVRTFLPRIAGSLEGFTMLPTFDLITLGYVWPSTLAALANPKITESFASLLRAVGKQADWGSAYGRLGNELIAAGYPSIKEQTTLAPFDLIADNLRGTRGVMLDMYRQPDRLLAAIEMVTPLMINIGTQGAKRRGNPRVFIPLHKGTDDFMSEEQYKRFYWPSLQKLILGLINADCNPYLLFEGKYTSRLHIIRDVPKGKCIYHFEDTDMTKAKEVLGDIVCLMGNVPLSLLFTGTTDEVEEYCKKLIDVVGDGGGFIMSAGGLIDEAKTENVKTMIDFTKEYGVYGDK